VVEDADVSTRSKHHKICLAQFGRYLPHSSLHSYMLALQQQRRKGTKRCSYMSGNHRDSFESKKVKFKRDNLTS